MVTVVLTLVSVISLYIAWNIIKYNKQIKKDERYNKRVIEDRYREEQEVKRSAEISKDQVSNKRKYRSTKKKAKAYKSIDELILADPTALDQIDKDFGIDKKKNTNKSKVKKNARRNKKKV